MRFRIAYLITFLLHYPGFGLYIVDSNSYFESSPNQKLLNIDSFYVDKYRFLFSAVAA